MPRVLLLLLVLIVSQSTGWVLAGWGCATGGCAGPPAADPAPSACCCARADQPPSEACCNDAEAVGSSRPAAVCAAPTGVLTCSPCGPSRCDPRACVVLARGLPLLPAEETRPKTINPGESRVASPAAPWAALVLDRIDVPRDAVGSWPSPPPESAGARRARLCIWTI